jgi:NDP-sugar pyrophosphorylase family protein
MSAPRALVLAAGLGTRLRPLTYIRAKAAVPVNGVPLARRVVRWLVAQGVTDLVLNLHHRPETITAAIGDGSDLGARVRYSWEDPVLGSAGGPRHALDLLKPAGGDVRLKPEAAERTAAGDGRTAENGTFILVNGDTLTDVDIAAVLDRHHRSGALVTMALIPNPDPGKYGGVQVSNDGWITGFTRAGTPGESWHFIGVQAASVEAFATLADGVPAESVNALYPALMARQPRAVAAFTCAASFRDIGTPADYLRTSVELAGAEGDHMWSARSCRASSARLVRTALWDDVSVGDAVELVDCIVCDGARIPDGARYERCALLPAADRTPANNERIDGGLLVAAL